MNKYVVVSLGTEEYVNGYLEGFLDGCLSVEGNDKDICNSAMDA
jgi:hypothetical protein